MTLEVDDAVRAALVEDGYAVLPRVLDAGALGAEVDAALAEGHRGSDLRISGAVGNAFQYVPMATAATPMSLGLLATVAAAGTVLLGRPALPLRAKGTRYFGGTDWHRDSELAVASLGFLAYLEPLDPASGALRVVPGSHRLPLAPPTDDEAGLALSTEPGDLIVLDEHLLHASHGGEVRRQWRVDVFADPLDDDEVAAAARYLDDTFQVGWDGGYDVDRFPSFGPDWRANGGPWVARLDALGAPARAEAEEHRGA